MQYSPVLYFMSYKSYGNFVANMCTQQENE